MKTMTKYQMIRRDYMIESSKKAAQFYLDTFNWKDEQRELLEHMSTVGYMVADYNRVRTIFGMPQSIDDKEKRIVCVSMPYTGSKRKRDIQIYPL